MKGSLALAALLAGAGAFHHFVLRDDATQAGAHGLRVAQQRNALEHCRQAAHMIFDVHWAAACMAEADQPSGSGDGHAECDLPDAKAAVVNAWLVEAEARCEAEASAVN
jgi:hypothetical protein